MTVERKEFEKRLLSIGILSKKKPKYTVWFVWKNVTIHTKEKGYMVCYWASTEEYAGRKELYQTVDYSCSNEKFLLNLLGRVLTVQPNDY